MEQTSNRSSQQRFVAEQGTDALVVAGWMIKVHIREEAVVVGGDVALLPPGEDIQLLMSSGTTIRDIKMELSNRYDVAYEDQRLYNEENHEPIFGSLSSQEVKLILKIVPLDPRLKSLFEMVHMGDPQERDELMAMMRTSRVAGHCPCGQRLAVVEKEEFNKDNLLSYTCVKCRWKKSKTNSRRCGNVFQKIYVCKGCNFALCTKDLSEDRGLTIVEDPYEAIVDLARRLGSQFASNAAWFGGIGHMCGLPSINFEEEISPKAYRYDRFDGDNSVKVSDETQVLNKGIRLIIELSDDMKSILQNNGIDYSDNNNNVEFDEILPDGATTEDIKNYRSALPKKSSLLWKIIAEELSNRFPAYSGRPYTYTTLISFDEKIAKYVVSAHIDDGDY